MTTAIFVESVNGASYGLTPGWDQFAPPPNNSRFPFCVGRSMSTPSVGYVQNETTKWTFGNASFTGTGLSFMGLVYFLEYPPDRSLPYPVDTIASTIDGGEPQYHNLTTPYITHMYEFFKIGQLSEGQHLLNLTQIPNTVTWDWATITPGPNMTIKDEILQVDDVDELIAYSGNWEQTQESFIVGSIPDKNFYYYHSSYGGSAHVARAVNDILQFPFTGTSVSVQGFFHWDVPGNISVTFQVDNLDSVQISFPTPSTSATILNQTRFQMHTEPNFQFYASDPLPAGDHILTMNVTEVTGEQSIIIDTIRYRASFETLNTMPKISLPSLESSGTISPSKSSSNVGPIAGGILGGIAFLLIVLTIGLLARQKRRRNVDESVMTMADPFLAEKGTTPPDIPEEALVFEEPERPPSPPRKRRGPARSVSNIAEQSPPPPTAAQPVVLLSVLQEEEEIRVQDLEREVQEATREHKILVEGQVSPLAYAGA